MDRRSFVAALGSLTAAAACRARPVTAAGAASAQAGTAVGPIGLQLYTVRDAMQRDMPGTLARVASIGYKEVEFAGYYGRSPAEVRALLAQNGLTSPSSHLAIDLMRGAWQKTLDDAKAIGHEWATIPWLAPQQRPTTADGWKQLAAELNRGAEQAHAAGLKFAYHNHDFEFARADGQVPLDLLLTQTDPARVDFEMDVYWVTKAGADPLDLFARYPGRFKLLHIKDASAAPQRDMRPVGQGTIPWPRVLAARPQAGTQHIFVEHDSAAEWGGGDAFKSVTESYQYLASLK
jgi:sugar phosphate isomerase/epimerase